MTSNVNEVLNDSSFVEWRKNLRELSKVELERKETGTLHALESKREQNRSMGLPSEEGTDRLTAQLEACYNELAKCDLQTSIMAISPGTQPFGIENPRSLETVKCKHCAISRLILSPSGDLTILTNKLLQAFIKRASARVIEQLTEDHRLMMRHARALSIEILLRE
jgi:hypothetical protein